MVTDDDGARALVDGIGLDFDRVSLDLNALKDHDSAWWALGKLYAYRVQDAPFAHIDSDVYLWNPLPDRLLSAPVLAQNPEYFVVGSSSSYYKPERLERLVRRAQNGWMPEEWLWCRHVFRHHQKAACCGICGGNRLDFIAYYADRAINLIEHPSNRAAFARLRNKAIYMILPEQYFLTACIDYHGHRPESPFSAVRIEYLFPSLADFYNAETVGYTHLIAKSKKNPGLMLRLENRVKTHYPNYYDRCMKYLS